MFQLPSLLCRYSDLFALAEDYDPKPVKKGKGASTKGKAKRSPTYNDSNTDSNASEVNRSDFTQRKKCLLHCIHYETLKEYFFYWHFQDDVPPVKQTKQSNSRKKKKTAYSDSD